MVRERSGFTTATAAFAGAAEEEDDDDGHGRPTPIAMGGAAVMPSRRSSLSSAAPLHPPPGLQSLFGTIVEGEDREVRDLVAAELKGYKNPEIATNIRKRSEELSHKIGSLQKSIEREATYKEDIESLKRNKIPTGMRPFTLQYDNKLLDSLKAQFTAPPIDITECTIREAKERLYIWHLQAQRLLDMQMIGARVRELKEQCKKPHFVDACMAGAVAKVSPLVALGIEDDMELDRPEDLGLRAKVLTIYGKIVDKAALAKQRAEDSKAKKGVQKQKVIADLLTKTPDDLLKMTINECLKAKGKETPSSASLYHLAQKGNLNEQEIGKVLDRSHQQKNGETPAKSGGIIKNESQQPAKGTGKAGRKGNGKGKDKAKGKGKGTKKDKGGAPPKGKGKSNDSTKGKGKGKGGSKGKGKGGKNPLSKLKAAAK